MKISRGIIQIQDINIIWPHYFDINKSCIKGKYLPHAALDKLFLNLHCMVFHDVLVLYKAFSPCRAVRDQPDSSNCITPMQRGQNNRNHLCYGSTTVNTIVARLINFIGIFLLLITNIEWKTLNGFKTNTKSRKNTHLRISAINIISIVNSVCRTIFYVQE